MADTVQNYVELHDINKNYGDFQGSHQINFGIEKGKLVALLGPSGSGKTTILRMIAGLETPDSGEIKIDGQVVNHIPANKRGIGFVFQSYALFRYMTVYDNIAMGLQIQKVPKQQIRERVTELLDLVSLKGLENRYPNQLSGGQRQRVAFARAIAPNPQLLLLDEPFAAIDAKVRQELRSWLKEMIGKLGITSIFVTHDQDEAMEVADEIILTNRGRIEQIGSPSEIYTYPKTAFTASFFGQNAQLEGYQAFHTFRDVPGADKALIRSEFVKVYKLDEKQQYPESSSVGTVEQISFRGDRTELQINVNGLVIIAKRNLGESPIAVGERVKVFLYRIFVLKGEEVILLENEAVNSNYFNI